MLGSNIMTGIGCTSVQNPAKQIQPDTVDVIDPLHFVPIPLMHGVHPRDNPADPRVAVRAAGQWLPARRAYVCPRHQQRHIPIVVQQC